MQAILPEPTWEEKHQPKSCIADPDENCPKKFTPAISVSRETKIGKVFHWLPNDSELALGREETLESLARFFVLNGGTQNAGDLGIRLGVRGACLVPLCGKLMGRDQPSPRLRVGRQARPSASLTF